MTKSKTSWSYQEGNKTRRIHSLLSRLSVKVRQSQFDLFLDYMKPKKSDTVADIGASSVEVLPDINFFEKNYAYLEQLTAVSIDEPLDFAKKYPRIKFIQIEDGEKLPFADNSLDIVVSWATLEHVGNKQKQQYFLKEIFRIGKKVFITTPYRGCPYEPHSGFFFFHWLPRKWFYKICGFFGKNFWASEVNLRCLWRNEVEELLPVTDGVKILTYKTFGIIPSHLIIIKS